jgi:hypothetical protein
VTVAPVFVRRRALTVRECAVRWGVTQKQALMFLEGFEARGYAKRRGRFWSATARARALGTWDGDPV